MPKGYPKSKTEVKSDVETAEVGDYNQQERVDARQQDVNILAEAIAKATTAAIEAAKPVVKKTIETRVKNTPWTPKDGSPKLKLKRKIYQHSIPVYDKFLRNEDITLCNQLRPGSYCDGWITVTRRRDKGLNIDYPIKTQAQRVKLSAVYRINSFNDLVSRLVEEGLNPKAKEFDPDSDD